MRQVVTTAPSRASLRAAEEPVPDGTQALVDVAVVGLCGSDLHLFTGDHPYSHFPLVQGHEFSGTVRALPDGYVGSARVGDLVAVEPYFSCGACFPCRRGHWNCCTRLSVLGAQVDGALCDVVAVDAAKLYVADGLTAELAALVEPVSIGTMAVSRAPLLPADQVLVIGAGPIGQAILLAATQHGARVMVADRIPSRLRLAEELGAELTVDTASQDLSDAVRDWTGGDGPAVVFEATGVPALVRLACAAVAPSGTVVVVGLSTADTHLPVVDFTRKELTVRGSRAGHFASAVELVRQRPLDVAKLVTHRFPLEDAHAALQIAVEHPADVEKVLVVVNDAPK